MKMPLLLMAFLWTGIAVADEPEVAQLTPPVQGTALRERAEKSYAKGVQYLLDCQNKDGSWGSHDPVAPMLKNFGFGTINRGSQDGVRAACTAIVAKALARDPQPSEAVRKALERAVQALLAQDKFSYERGEAFNTWGYGYKLDFLTEWLQDPRSEGQREAIRKSAAACVKGLLRYQQNDGGWNYYAVPVSRGDSMSFNTANIIVALQRATDLKIPVPAGMLADAVNVLKKMRTVRGSFLYDGRFIRPSLAVADMVNDVGSPARTAAATHALIVAGAYDLGDARIANRIFNEDEKWLEDGRKLIAPHTAVDQISGYFFFYGYYYHAELLTMLADEIPADRWERSAWTMIRTQEENGCWWDTAAAAYGDKWATGFALLVLQRYLQTDETATKGSE